MAISNLSSGFRPGVCTSTTRPSAPFEGQMIYETDTNRVLVWDNSAWVMIADTDQPPGMQLIVSGTTNTATTVSVNSCFSSVYTNYRVMMWEMKPSAVQDIRLRVRAGTTDLVNANYYLGNIFAGGTISTNTEVAQTSFRGIYTSDVNGFYTAWQFDIYRPFELTTTMIMSQATGWDGSTVINRSYTGFVDTSSSYDGFSIFVASPNTVSTKYAVYGYRI